MTYNIYSYGNGLALSDLLNGIVLVIGESGYDTFIDIGIMFAFGLIAISAMFDMKFGRIFKWYVTIMVIYAGLLVPKADVFVFDPVMLQITPTPVANVPIGLAFMLSTLTTIEYNLTNSVESALKTPQDLTYNSTGMLMASDMVRKASSFKILNQNFAQNIRSYLQQCVQYDILQGKYTADELFHASDIWEFTQAYNSPARAFIYNGEIQTCRDGGIKLNSDWTNELNTSIQIFGKRIFGNHQVVNPDANPATLLGEYMEAGYVHLGKISGTASKIMQQNMMINAYHDSVINNAAELGAAAAVESYAVARATQNSRSAYKISGEVAGRLLPYLKNVMQMLLIGSSVVILPLFFFPSGFMRLKHFVEILASLSLWAPLYAILNLQMTTAGRWKIIGLTEPANAADHAAITIANMPGIEQIAADQAILAGYLALSIPLISYGLIKSSMHAFTSLASGVMSVAHSSASQAAEEAVSGNYSLGNLSMENTNAYNTSAFHGDDNVRVSAGSTSVQDMNGSINTIFADGGRKTDHSEAMSKMAVSADFSSRMVSSWNASYQDNISEAQASSIDLSHATATALHDTYELAKTVGNSTSSDAAKSMGYSASDVKVLNDYAQGVDRIVESTGASENEVFSAMANANIGSKGVPLNIGGSLSATSTNDASVNRSDSISSEISSTKGFTDTMDSAMRVAADNSHRTSSDETTRASDSIRTNLDTVDTLKENISANMQEASSKQSAIAFAKDNAATINTSATNMVYNELLNTVNPETGQKYTNHDLSDPGINNAFKLQAISAPIVERMADNIIAQGVLIEQKGGNIKDVFEKNSQSIKEGNNIAEKYDNQKQKFKDKEGLNRPDNSITSKIDAKLKLNDKIVSAGKEALENKQGQMQAKASEDIGGSQFVKVVENTAKRVASPFADAYEGIKKTFNDEDK